MVELFLEGERLPKSRKEPEMTETTKTQTATKSYSPCYCGCGFVAGSKSLYKQGHDAKHVSVLLSYVTVGTHTLDEAKAQLPSTALQVKLHNALARRNRKQAKTANKAPKGKQQCDRCGAWVKEGMLVHDDLAEEAICDQCVANAIDPTEVKVGRWWYPIVNQTTAQITYTKRDGSEATTGPNAETR